MEKPNRIKIDEKFIEVIETFTFMYESEYNPFGYNPNREPIPQKFHHSPEVDGLSPVIKKIYLEPKKVLKQSSHYYPDKTDNSPYQTLLPYNVPIRIDLLLSIIKMAFKGQKPRRDKIYYFDELDFLFRRYLNSFVKEFHEFEENYITPFLMIENDKYEKAEKIAEFVLKRREIYKDRPGYTSLIDAGFLMGMNAGSEYKAWSLILNNESLFEPIFKDLDKKNSPTPTPKNIIEFHDFFTEANSRELAERVKTTFQNSPDKKITILIHILIEKRIIEILPFSVTKGRKKFVELLKGKSPSMSYINRILTQDNNLELDKKQDTDYQRVYNQLKAIIDTVV